MPEYTLKQIEADTGLKYDYLRKTVRYLKEGLANHARKFPGKGWLFNEQGLELFRNVAVLKEGGLDRPQIKLELSRLGYLETPEAAEVSGEGDASAESAGNGQFGASSQAPAPKTGEAFVMDILAKVDQANDKMEELRDKQFAKEQRMLKYQKRREHLLTQMEHMGFWSLLFKRKGIVTKLRKLEEEEAKRLRPLHIHDKETFHQAWDDPYSWVEE